MKSNTDLKQSKKLAEILPLESADTVIVKFGDREGTKTVVMPKETLDVLRTPFADIRDVTPCWSLTALFSVLPDIHLKKYIYDGNTKYYATLIGIMQFNSEHYDNPIDACVEMIIKLKEMQYF